MASAPTVCYLCALVPESDHQEVRWRFDCSGPTETAFACDDHFGTVDQATRWTAHTYVGPEATRPKPGAWRAAAGAIVPVSTILGIDPDMTGDETSTEYVARRRS